MPDVDALQAARCFEAADAGHPQVHQDDVRFRLAHQSQRAFAGVRFTDDHDPSCLGEHARKTDSYETVVVDNQHSDHLLSPKLSC